MLVGDVHVHGVARAYRHTYPTYRPKSHSFLGVCVCVCCARTDISNTLSYLKCNCINNLTKVSSKSLHNNFSTSAAICALGDYVGDRNRVTG